MKLLIDMNLSPRWVETLAFAGVEAFHWSKRGPERARPSDLRHAADHDFIILTHDLDFGAILALDGRIKPSVVQIRDADLRPEYCAGYVLSALRQTESLLMTGALVTVDPRRTRIRVLPLDRGQE